MFDEPVDVLLRAIDEQIEDISEANVDSILRRIDVFQQDPAKLEAGCRLSRYVNAVIRNFFILDCEAQLQRCRIFYSLCKVAKWKTIAIHLPTSVFLLSDLLAGLARKDSMWQYSYLLLSWVYVLTLAPFKFDEFYDEICATIETFRNLQILKPVVAHIHAQLLSKNPGLIREEACRLDLLTLNCLLKKIKPDDTVIDERALKHFNSVCFQENDSNTLKLLPKLLRINAAHENWEAVEDIISFYLNHLNDRFTDYRFALAHSFSKVISIMIDEFDDDGDAALQLIDSCIDRIKVCSRESSPAVVDHDLLHGSLLVVAELSNIIAVSWPRLLDTIAEEIVPFASRFEQVKMNEIRGSQIKDASNYICWALARSTRLPGVAISTKIKTVIFLNLLVCSLFDRDLTVRRSASAALQEVFGRCFASADILDNRTIVKLIELPILNLEDSYVKNACAVCNQFIQKQAYLPYAHFLLDWLIENCLFASNDLNIAKLTVRALSSLLVETPAAISILNIKLEDILKCSPHEEPHFSSRILLLLITLESKEVSILQNMKVVSQMEQYFKVVFASISLDHKIYENDHEEHFKLTVILKYWIFALKREGGYKFDRSQIEVFFHVARMTSGAASESRALFGKLVALLSRDLDIFFEPEDKALFWTNFEKFIRFNNSLVCSAIPQLPPHKFQLIVQRLLPALDCHRKADLLSTLNENLPRLIGATGTTILHCIVELLNDYTTTQQGDVGRLVRTGAAKIIARHREIFWNDENPSLTNETVANFLRLSGEQVTDLRQICFSTLCKAFTYDLTFDGENLNRQLLGFNRKFFGGECIDFWKGFMMSGGAIHFTDSEVTDAINSFLDYYEQLPQNQERLALCNILVRIIPSAKQIGQARNSHSKRPWGIMEMDILKVTVTRLNFWKRLFESGIVIDQGFNFDGFYAKIYNLNLINGSSLLKSLTIQILPYLISSQAIAIGALDTTFANKIICRLLSLARRGAQLKKPALSSIQRDSLQALIHIFLECESSERLETLRSASLGGDSLLDILESQLTL